MAHKVHPKVFRIKEITHWDSRWIAEKEFSKYLEEDFKIREFFMDKLKDAGIDTPLAHLTHTTFFATPLPSTSSTIT